MMSGDEPIKKTIVKRGNKWAVVSCHGGKTETLGVHDTKEGALKQHRAIMMHKQAGEAITSEEVDFERRKVKLRLRPTDVDIYLDKDVLETGDTFTPTYGKKKKVYEAVPVTAKCLDRLNKTLREAREEAAKA